MSNARTDKDTTSPEIDKTLSNPMDSLVEDAKKIAKFLGEIKSEDFIKIINDSLDDYDRPFKRYFYSKRSKVEAQLNQLGYDSKSANPTANLKSVKEIYETLTETGGKNDDSFIIILVRNIIKSLRVFDPAIKLSEVQCDRLNELIWSAIEKRLQYQGQINEQEMQLKQVQENRLREEESLLKTQLESAKCKTILSELMIEKSGTSAKLEEMEEEKRERERQLLEYQEKLQAIEREESEKRERLEKVRQEESKKKEELESIKNELEITRKKYACMHTDFDPGDLTLEQLERAKDTAEKAFMIHVASEKGKVKKDDELVQMNANKLRAKAMQDRIDEGFVDAEAKKARKARKKELKGLFGNLSEEEKEQAKIKKENFKEQLNLCFKLKQNQAEQNQVKEDKREMSLQNDGFFATVHEIPSILTPHENYSNDHTSNEASLSENPYRKLEKKPVPRSFKEMKMKQGMSSDKENVNKAFSKLNFFFSGKKSNHEPVVEEQKQSTLRSSS